MKSIRLLLDQGVYAARNAVSTQNDSPSRWLEVTQLEERVLMSASPLAVVAAPPEAAAAATAAANEAFQLDDQQLLDVVGDAVLPEQSVDGEMSGADAEVQPDTSTVLPDATEHTLELVFVDSSVSDLDQMVNDLHTAYMSDDNRTLQIVVLESQTDGMGQISSTMRNYRDIDAIHVVSHGSDGQVRLGSTTLSLDNLDDYRSSIGAWQDSMSSEADLLFYGCNLAATADGQELMNQISAEWDVDVAASDDLTGHSDFGGDWDLEYQTGDVETQIAFSTDLQENWYNVLAIAVDNSSDGGMSSGSTTTVSHTTSGDNRLMLVGVATDPHGESVASITYNGFNLSLVGAEEDSGSHSRAEIWSLVAPDTGSHDVVVTMTGNGHHGVVVGVMTFTGVDQTTPLENFSAASGASNTASTTVTSTSDDLVFGVVHSHHGSSSAAGAGQTEYWDRTEWQSNGSGTVEAGAASVTTSWTVTNHDWTVAAVSIRSASAPPVITNIETVDQDADGQIDQIRITTSETLNDNFGDLSIAVWGYEINTGVGTNGYTTGATANDNIFYVNLVESGTPDTDATPNISVVQNTLLTEDGGPDALAADQGRIVFPRDSNIYTAFPNGNNEILVLDDPAGLDNYSPFFSSDRSKIFFYSDRDGTDNEYDIWSMDADGSNLAQLTNNGPDDERYPQVSPDGTKVLYERDAAGNTDRQIWIMDADGSNETLLINSAGEERQPSWSPDGSQIVFVSDRDGPRNIYVADADGGNQTRLTNSADQERAPAWSPDGTQILYHRNVGGTDNQAWIMDADGGNQTMIVNSLGEDANPSWSPDGSRIIFTSTRDGNDEIYTADPNGMSEFRVTNNGVDENRPRWASAETVAATDDADPVATITRDDADPTSADTVNFSVDFSEDVSNVTADDFTVVTTGTVTANMTVTVTQVTASTYTITIDTIAGDGTVGLDFNGATDIVDGVGNAINTIPSTDEVYTIDRPPLITARETVDSDGDGEIDQIRITTDQNLNDNFGDLNISVAGYTINTGLGTNGFTTGTGGDNEFFVNLNESGTPDTDATPGVSIIVNTSLGDSAGNLIFNDTPTSLTTVTFTGTSDADTGIDPTANTYTHAVDFRGADATPTPAVINGLAFADGTNAAGQTDANTGNGFGLTGAGGTFQNYTGVWADPGSGLEELTRDFYYNGNPGTLTLSDLTPGETYKLRLFVAGYTGFDQTFTDDNGFNGGNVDRGGPNNTFADTIEYVFTMGAADTEIEISLTPTGVGSFHWYGFTNEVYNPVATTDAADPVAFITRDDANPTNATSVDFSVDFSEDVSNVTADDFTVVTTGTATANATVTVTPVDGSTYTITVDTIAGDGTVGLDFNGPTDIDDIVANPVNTTPFTDEVYTIDQPPEITARETVDSDGDGQIDQIRITTGENLNDNFSDLVIRVNGIEYSAADMDTGATALDNVFNVNLTPSGTPDTDATPYVAIVANTMLADGGAAPDALSPDGGPGWWDVYWQNRQQITLDWSAHPGADRIDFPVRIQLDSGDVDFSKIKAGGADIRFRDADGSELSYEIETWDDVGETATIWVKIPVLDTSSSQIIHLYYNNPTAIDDQDLDGTWAANFAGVYHLDESGTAANGFQDSSGNGVHGQGGDGNPIFAPIEVSPGHSGDHQLFDGANDHVNFASRDFGNQFTIEAWIKPDNTPNAIQGIVANSATGFSTQGFRFFIRGDDGTIRLETRGPSSGSAVVQTAASQVNFGVWNHVAVTVDRTAGTATIYHNGVNVATGAVKTDFPTNSDWEIGGFEDRVISFDGEIDEVRVSSTARDASHILASYMSQLDDSLNTFGVEEEVGVVATDAAAPVLISATTPQSDGSNLFQAEGQTLDLVFSEALGASISEVNLEIALLFGGGASDGDNLPTPGTGANPIAFTTTNVANDTLRVTFNTNNVANADWLRVGTHTVQIADGSNLDDAVGNDGNTAGAAVTITGVANTAPVLDNTGDMTLTDVAEDDTNPPGNTVQAIIDSAAGDRVTDVDFFSVEGIAVTDVDDTDGTWQYNTGSGWTIFGSVTDNAAVLLNDAALIRFVPNGNYNGSAGDITFRAWDRTSGVNGQIGVDVSANGGSTAFSIATETATLDVSSINDEPTISAIPDQTLLEDTSTGAIAFTISDVETAAGALTLTATSSDQALVPDGNITLGGTGANRTINVLPAANQTGGPATITVTVDDGTTANQTTFDVTVSAVNDEPTISAIPDQTTLEDTATGNIAFTVSDVETAAGTLTVTATSSDQNLIPNGNITLGGTGANRTINVLPAANQTGGPATITVTVDDGTTANQTTFDVTVSAVNDEPTISAIPDQTTLEDTATGNIAFTVSDVETAAGTLTVTATSSDQNLIPNGNITLGGTGANRTINVLPAANQTGGPATITVTVDDGTTANQTTFDVTVSAVNDEPTISAIPDQTTLEDTATGDIAFTVSDVETAAGTLTVTATSSDQALVPDGNITLGGTGANRTINVLPAANQTGGPATITVTVDDGTTANQTTFDVTVSAVNDEPTISAIPDQTTLEDTATGNIAFTVSDVETAAGTLTVTATSSDQNLIPNGNITLGGTGANRTINVLPAANQTGGPATITVTVDDGTTANQTTFDVTVSAVNDEPTIDVALSGSVVDENSANGTIIGNVLAADIDVGDSLTFSLLDSAGGRFAVDSATGLLTVADGNLLNYELASSHGITARVTDSGGLSGDESYMITVSDLNEAPTALNDTFSVRQLEDLVVPAGAITGNDFDSDGDIVTVVLVASPAEGTLTLAADGSFTYTSSGSFSGHDQFTYYVTDGTLNSAVATVNIDVLMTLPTVNAIPVADNYTSSGAPTATVDAKRADANETTVELFTDNTYATAVAPVSGTADSTTEHDGGMFATFEIPAETMQQTSSEMSVSVFLTDVPESDFRHEGIWTQQNDSAESDDGMTVELGQFLFRQIETGSVFFSSGQVNSDNSDYWQQQDDHALQEQATENMVVGSTAMVSTSVSVGYVVWLLRGGSLLTTFLSSLPVWQAFDPLHVLNSFEENNDDDQGGESLASLVS